MATCTQMFVCTTQVMQYSFRSKRSGSVKAHGNNTVLVQALIMSRINTKYGHETIVECGRHAFLEEVKVKPLDEFNEELVASAMSVIDIKL